MKKESVMNVKVTRKNVVIEIPKDFIIKDFDEQIGDYKIKGNRKNKFFQEVAEQLEEHIINEDVLFNIYDCLLDSENVKYIEED